MKLYHAHVGHVTALIILEVKAEEEDKNFGTGYYNTSLNELCEEWNIRSFVI